ncbi:hypothetical protein [Bacillus cereus]|uniref:hypothetical protein n=1 Tax=Bacillus cereus TaxID=1396 RepID=UPI000BF4C08E|nr:hypothetical protein [Bacillus cereus]PFA93074.1 hypothetical protein CN393_01900 [Bacillus cereus]
MNLIVGSIVKIINKAKWEGHAGRIVSIDDSVILPYRVALNNGKHNNYEAGQLKISNEHPKIHINANDIRGNSLRIDFYTASIINTDDGTSIIMPIKEDDFEVVTVQTNTIYFETSLV